MRRLLEFDRWCMAGRPIRIFNSQTAASMTAIGVEELARAWVAAQSNYDRRIVTQKDWSVIFIVQRLANVQPEILWMFVLCALAQKPNESILGILAASPLEDLIRYHGADFIDRIARKAAGNPSFAALLPKVWLSASDDAITKRYIQLGCDPVQAVV